MRSQATGYLNINTYVDKVKFRHLGHRGSTTMFYDIVSGRYVHCEVKHLSKNELAMVEQNGVPRVYERVDTDRGVFLKCVDWRRFNRWLGYRKRKSANRHDLRFLFSISINFFFKVKRLFLGWCKVTDFLGSEQMKLYV